MAIKTAYVGVGTTLASMMTLLAGTALAGPAVTCGVAGGPACDAGTVIVSSPPVYADAMTVENRQPYDFLDSVHFQRSPHVAITRIHGLDTKVGLTDAPVGFTKGCHPESTTYCRSGSAKLATPPVVKPPVVVAPKPRPPIYRPLPRPPVVVIPPAPCGAVRLNPCGQPVAAYGQVSQRVVATGKGFDPSKFTPRIYGDPYTITPGIAHVPTSIVDRDPYRAQAVLDSGQARPNPWIPGGITPALSGQPIAPDRPYPFVTHRPATSYGVSQMTGSQTTGRYGLSQSQTVISQTQSSRYSSGYTAGQYSSGSRYSGQTVCRQAPTAGGVSPCSRSFPRAMSRY